MVEQPPSIGRILIVEDDPLQATMLNGLLKKWGYTCNTVTNGQGAINQVNTTSYHAILLDMMMPEMDGMATLGHLRAHHPNLPIIILTGMQDLNQAVAAMKAGAFDYLTKPYDPPRLQVSLTHALKMGALTRVAARAKWTDMGDLTFADLIGATGGLQPAITIGERVAQSDLPILILGETGTGKEVFARALHGESVRATRPFVAVNCGAIPENLIESILFGHEKGAFTGATERTLGKFREAEGGTIFLDEIGEMPLPAQIRLLRVLQQHTIEPVGSTREVKINVRVVSATHRDLQQDISNGRFREDLFYRLNVVPITLPPLRHRRGDLPALVTHFIDRYQQGDIASTLDTSAWEKINTHPFPGNVRQLENTIRRSLALADHPVLSSADILIDAGSPLESISAENLPTYKDDLHIPLLNPSGHVRTLADLEQDVLQMTLSVYHGNITAAARALNIAKSTYYRRLNDQKMTPEVKSSILTS